MRPVLAIARVNLKRMLRDRSNIFFVFVFPLLLVLLIGMQFGGSAAPRLALHVPEGAGPLAEDLVDRVADADVFEIDRVATAEDTVDAVSRGIAAAGLTLPADYDTTLRSGGTATVGYVARQDGNGPRLRATVEAVVAEQGGILRAARVAVDETGASLDDALARADAVDAALPGVAVEVTRVGESRFDEFDRLGQFDLGASSQLLLFVFLTSLAGSAALIQSRSWGVSRRMLSTPTRAGQVLVGEAGGRFLVALVQALYIVVGTAVVFDVTWGDPLGAAAVIVAFCLVSAGAGMLLGAWFDNDAQAGGMGVFLGLGLAALGGSMAPIEVFPAPMRTVAHVVTPHAWANDAFAELVRRGGGIGDILSELGILLGAGLVLLALASWRLHRVLVRA